MRGHRITRRSAVVAAVASSLLLGATGARAQEPQLVDRIVAVVDGEIITLGQLDRAISGARTDFSIDTGICDPEAGTGAAAALGTGAVAALGTPGAAALGTGGVPTPGTPGAAAPATEDVFARQMLDCMIDDMVAFQHVRRFPQFAVLQDDIDAEYQRMVQQYDNRAAFEEALKRQGLTAAEVRYDLERVALVGNYVQIRYRDVIDVGETEMRRYYEEVLRPEMAREGAEMPAFEAVNNRIEAILAIAESNRRTEDWIADLRRRAEIVVYLW